MKLSENMDQLTPPTSVNQLAAINPALISGSLPPPPPPPDYTALFSDLDKRLEYMEQLSQKHMENLTELEGSISSLTSSL